jgi:hypothetical protein
MEQFRHELKYNINFADYFSLQSRLKHIAHQDSHGGVSGKYKVRSLYFDNLDDKALMEKINGLNVREKFRIRYYNDNPLFIKLEKKSKVNGLGRKSVTIVSKEQVEKLLGSDFGWMLDTEDPLLLELYAKMKYQLLRPKTVVDYFREAYIYSPGNVRVTLDSNVRSGLFSRDLFNPELPTLAVTNSGQIILEVKFDNFLPEAIRDIIQTNERQNSAISKYAACRKFC